MSQPFDLTLAELEFLAELLVEDAERARDAGDHDEAKVRGSWATFVGEVKTLLDDQHQRLVEAGVR